MRKRDRAGLSIAPLFLRLALAVTFIWAGSGKLFGTMEVEGETAAILANYGVIQNPNLPAAPPPDADAAPETPEEELVLPDPEEVETPPEQSPPGDTPPDELETDEPPRSLAGGALLASWQTGEPRFLATGADFPEPVEVRKWAGLVLMLHNAINPGVDAEDSTPRMRLWPDLDPTTDYDPWPRWLAIAAALTELIAGLLVAVGLLTRLASLPLAGVMVVAMWLTQFGPAIQAGTAQLGFLPDHPPFDTDAWKTLLWQFAILCAALALFFAGPGALSLDRLLLGRGGKKAEAKEG